MLQTIGPRHVTGNGAGLPPGCEATVEWVREQFRMAGRAIRAQRLTARDVPQGARSGWPDIVRSQEDLYAAMVGAESGQQREMVSDRYSVRPSASRADVDALDRCVPWLLWLDRDRQVVVLGRALRYPAGRIAELLHVSRRTVYNYETEAFEEIIRRL